MKISATTGFFILLLVIAYPLFGNIGYYPIRLWDESRVAINAYEMYKSGNWLIPTFGWGPDMWNTKPPLLIWIQVGFMKLFGINELSIRIVSPLAAVGTCIFLYWLSIRRFGQPWIGILVCFILVTSQGYVRQHGTRTGEYDSLMVMFTTMYVLYYFLFIEESKSRFLYLSIITLSLGVLTKGVAATLFLPALLLYTLYRRQFFALLKNKHLYIGCFIFLLFGVGYYILREYRNPGYIAQVRINELGGRYLETERPGFDYTFYYHFLGTTTFVRWLVLMFIGGALGFFSTKRHIRQLSIYCGLAGLIYFVIVSAGETKNVWYDMACYPFFAIVTAIGIYIICRFVLEFPSTKPFVNHVLVVIFIVSISWLPYYEIVRENMYPSYQDWSQEHDSITFYIRDVFREKREVPGLSIAYENYQADMEWYQILLAEKGKAIPWINYKTLVGGERLIAYQAPVKEYIVMHYNTRILDSFNTLRVYEVLSVK